jgi:hypothetical protein
MSLPTRQELRLCIAPRYNAATKVEKQKILDEFTAATGYHRKYANYLLKHDEAIPASAKPAEAPGKQDRRRQYDDKVKEALIVVWETASQICSKRLVPFLPQLVDALERHGHLTLSAETRAKLLALSPATMDRLLTDVRRVKQGGAASHAARTSLLKQQVAIRTFSDWDDVQPGYVEADLVAHCGTNSSGNFLYTLTMTDVVTGWTECQALLFRSQEAVVRAVSQLAAQLPMALLGLDTDNGSEFLNNGLLDYCTQHEIDFTRCRAYKKNDQCFVEQKNGAIVRKFIGYDRFEGVEACRILTELYRHLRLHINFFQPSLKLFSKQRQGSRMVKKYEQAQTPYQRVLAAETIPTATKEALKTQFAALDPLALQQAITALQEELWHYANPQSSLVLHPTITAEKVVEPTPIPQSPAIVDQSQAPDTARFEGDNFTNQAAPLDEKVTQHSYRHSPRQRHNYTGPRYWRTRPDPLLDVWDEVKQVLEQQPHLVAKTLFLDLQKKYPGRFSDGQLRTFQRRVSAWRIEYAGRDLHYIEDTARSLLRFD